MNQKWTDKYFRKCRGQSATEGALGLVVIAVVVFCLVALFAPKEGVPDGTKDLFAELEMAIQRAGGDTTTNQQVTVSDHGLNKHLEAKAIQDSCNQNGPYQTWKDKYEKGKYYFVCKVGNQFGLIPIVSTATGLVGKTAFSPGAGSLNEVLKYLGNTATRYNGVVR